MTINNTGLNIDAILGNNISNVPSSLFTLLEVAGYYYSKNSGGVIAEINIIYGSAGATDSNSYPLVVKIPKGSGGLVSVNDAYSANGSKNTFLTYDDKAALVHELGHVVLALIGLGKGSTDEINLAVLNIAANVAIGNTLALGLSTQEEIFDNIVKELHIIYDKSYQSALENLTEAIDYGDSNDVTQAQTELSNTPKGWTIEEKVAIARTRTGSYENVFNDSRNYAEESGLSNISGDLYRTGYATQKRKKGSGVEYLRDCNKFCVNT